MAEDLDKQEPREQLLFLIIPPPPILLLQEQHQALLYQLVQQQHHHQHHHQSEVQQLQITGGAQIPINNLLSGTQASPLNAASTNPFLTIHGDNAAQKVTVSIFLTSFSRK